jgi:hypothetical protein
MSADCSRITVSTSERQGTLEETGREGGILLDLGKSRRTRFRGRERMSVASSARDSKGFLSPTLILDADKLHEAQHLHGLGRKKRTLRFASKLDR